MKTLAFADSSKIAGADCGCGPDLKDSGSSRAPNGSPATGLSQTESRLLDLSKLEAGVKPLTFVERDLIAFCRERVLAFESLASSKGLNLQLETNSEEALLYFDLESFETIFENLLSNAIKYSSSGGDITVRVECVAGPGRIRWTVADEGVGIAKDNLKRIFFRFHRLQLDEAQPGTGIGLALVEELVKRHTGTIDVESEPGAGSRFILEFPQGEAHLEPEDLWRAPLSHGNESNADEILGATGRIDGEKVDGEKRGQLELKAPTLLLAEDDHGMRAYLRRLLASRFVVIEACDGDEASDLAISLIPDLVLTDISIPRVDGLCLAQALRQDKRTDHIPIVFLTARGSVDSRVEGYRHRIDAYLTKPFDPRELVACMEGLR